MSNEIIEKLKTIDVKLKKDLPPEIIGEDFADLSKILIELSYDKKLFILDVATNRIYSEISPTAKNNMIDRREAKDLFNTHIRDKLWVKISRYLSDGEEYKIKRKPTRTHILFNNILTHCRYDSRIQPEISANIEHTSNKK